MVRSPTPIRAFVGGSLPLVAVLLVSGCTAGGHGTSSSRTSTRGVAGHLSTGNLSPDLLTGFFPVTGAELDQPSAIRALRYEILQDGFSACMKAQGYRVPGFQGDGPQHEASMPDLGYIKAHGFLIYGSSDAGVDLSTASTAAQQAYDGAVGHCSTVSEAPLTRFDKAVVDLSSRWVPVQESVQGDPAVVRAYAGFVRCLHKAGINVADEDAFFAYVDGLHNERAQYQAAQIYLPCITPVEKVRLPLRQSLRETFIADHQDAMGAAQQAADQLAHQYASAYASAAASP